MGRGEGRGGVREKDEWMKERERVDEEGKRKGGRGKKGGK